MTLNAAQSVSAKATEPTNADCKSCCASKCDRLSGLYQMTCLHCCARLVLSTNPDRLQAKSMLEAIGMYRDAPSRADTLRLVGEMLKELDKPKEH